MKYFLSGLLLIISSFSFSDTPLIYENRNGTVREFGNIAEFALPVGALGYSLMSGDYQGAWQMTKVAASTGIIVESIKRSASRKRPDGTKFTSFPSGHTSSAFTGAAYINHRYGLLPSLPLYAAASVVGYSRVWANRHFTDDVIAGASIAVLSSLYFTTPFHEKKVRMFPSYQGDRVAMNVEVDLLKEQNAPPSLHRLPHHFELDLGAGDTVKHTLRQEQGNFIDFDALGDRKYETFASVQWHFNRNNTYSYLLHAMPFESRHTENSPQALTLTGQTFAANTDIVSAYRYWVMGGSMFYNMMNAFNRLGVGLDLSWYHFSNRLESVDGQTRAEVNKSRFLPALSVYYSRVLTPHLELNIETRYTHLFNHKSWLLSKEIVYRFDPHWDLGLGFSRYENRVDTSTFDSQSKYNMYSLQIGYSF